VHAEHTIEYREAVYIERTRGVRISRHRAFGAMPIMRRRRKSCRAAAIHAGAARNSCNEVAIHAPQAQFI